MSLFNNIIDINKIIDVKLEIQVDRKYSRVVKAQEQMVFGKPSLCSS